MTRYRKRPVEVDAMQLIDDLGNHMAIAEWIVDNGGAVTIPPLDPHLIIHTLDGDMRADLGDWIIRGTKGEFYPCKPDIFAEVYEPVNVAVWVHSCGAAGGSEAPGPCKSCGLDGTWSTTLTVVTS